MYFDINFLLILNLQQDGTELFNFVDGHQSWPDYLRNMAADGTWGDHVILHAAANCFKTCIHVISSDLTICPEHDVGSSSPLVLGHLHELHYVSLKPGIVTYTHIKQWMLTSTVQKECKRISSKFGYCSTENSPIFRAKFRDFFGRKFERIFESRAKIRVHPRNFANPRTKFRSDFVSTETKFRIADRKFL